MRGKLPDREPPIVDRYGTEIRVGVVNCDIGLRLHLERTGIMAVVGGPEGGTFDDLSPDQARELADRLTAAAEYVG